MKRLHIILDPGHGLNGLGTSGKCSPKLDPKEWDLKHPFVYDGRYREGNSNREIVKRLTEKLEKLGYTVHNSNPENFNMSLTERVRRTNKLCKEYGSKNCLFISVHSNAAPSSNGGWTSATGTSVHIASKCSENSKWAAQVFYVNAVDAGLKGNRSRPQRGYWVNDFYVVRKTDCPAFLSENLFYNNKEDLRRLFDDNVIDTIVDVHVKTIEQYYNKYFN